MRVNIVAAAIVAAMAVLWSPTASAQECFIGEVRMFAGNFAPRGWALAQGQLLPVAQNTALFSILGTTYGGDGRTTFALPDLRGRVAIGAGRGPGLTDRRIGQTGGAESTTLTAAQMPSHNHAAQTTSQTTTTLSASAAAANNTAPNGHVLGATRRNAEIYASDSAPGAAMAAGAAQSTTSSTTQIGNTGGGQPFDALQPYAVLNHIICLQGTYPSRS